MVDMNKVRIFGMELINWGFTSAELPNFQAQFS